MPIFVDPTTPNPPTVTARSEIAEVLANTVTGRPIINARVEIRKRATNALATIYAAEIGATTLANPLFSGTDGTVEGWLEDGAYMLIISAQGFGSPGAPIAIECINGDGYVSIAELANAAATGSNATQASLDVHTAATTSVHGIPDTSVLVSHLSATLNVHGIADTSKLVLTNTTATQTLQSSLTLANQKKLTLTVSDGGSGSITRLVELHATNIVDRPWIGWFDHNSRLVGASGFHDSLNVAEGGTQLKQFEIKTLADPLSTNPTEQRTRFAVQYDVQRGTWGVNFIDNFEINQGENPITTYPVFGVVPAGMRIRLAPQDTIGGTVPNFIAAQYMAQVDAADNTFAFFDVNVPYQSGGTLFPGNKTATLNFFRNTNTSSASSPQLAIKKGDGTNTNALLFTAKSGFFELPLALSSTTGIKLGNDTIATLYRSAASTVKTDATLDASTLGIATKVKAGVPADADFTTPANGLLELNSANGEIYARMSAHWRSLSSSAAKQSKAVGYAAETMSRAAAINTQLMVTQQVYYAGVYLKDADVLTNVVLHIGAAATVQPTNFFVGLFKASDGTQKAISADAAATISTTTGQKTIAFLTPYTVPDGGEGLYYVAYLCVQATGTLPSPICGSKTSPGNVGSNPRPWANESTLLSTLPSPATFAAGSAQMWSALT